MFNITLLKNTSNDKLTTDMSEEFTHAGLKKYKILLKK
jgi:hypothetical protein